jgi:Holliday junction resolvase RusA-like endonuclease
MEAVLVTVGIPPRSLSPNARVHWAVKMKATKKALVESWAQCQIAMHEQGVKGGWKGAFCQATWFARDSRRRDRDNLQFMLKATLDGLVHGGLLIDDDNLIPYPVVIAVDSKRPRVELQLKETDGTARQEPLL